MERLLILILALIIDRIVGDPHCLWKRIPHPVAIIGHLIAFLEKKINKKRFSSRLKRVLGFFMLLFLLFGAFAFGMVIHLIILYASWFGLLIEACVACIFFAQKSLSDHVLNVKEAFSQDGLKKAQKAVSMIVGRNTEMLDESAICRATIESLAENSSDGVIAPVFWYILFGLPGLIGYKTLNTADSMIGYKNDRYREFGWASARLDDVANFIPARLTALITLIALKFWHHKTSFYRALHVILKDANNHRSPNAGWPECAYAGGLNIQLAGPRYYDCVHVNEPFQNFNGTIAKPNDITRALHLFYQSMNVLLSLLIFSLVIYSLISL
ncbi:adenosylcobinamide-phosphate synthase CbiB [Bartonella tamiae]|uniref:Cobalamin biosynthesis protein CobD n=1 Tax=Bartonella tamiae Th239 TaxID=1094558 RepID=J0R0B3_9HYPH|nr:adenosylcobinamide-phosphate synthase CbiB [Bartonella tamiae]EJF88919.1 cobalamin biosynthesis protein CobD [Bartonella tamiae Th239]EJF94831.1 cobalamin biosynthesis protein CobD [Bartonella tamiae Th307]